MVFEGSPEWRALQASGDILSDEEERALKEALHSGDTSKIGSRVLKVDEEPVVDALRALDGVGPVAIKREKALQVMVLITPTAKVGLIKAAEDLGYWHGGRGNLSMLFEALGQGKLTIGNPYTER